MTLRFAILHMLALPDIQTKVQEEIDRVVGELSARVQNMLKVKKEIRFSVIGIQKQKFLLLILELQKGN